jgi:3-phenylpropionate/trans-cinnamate dioxygenase ferredoxin subunit
MVKMVACFAADLPPGSMLNVDILGHAVLVANVDGTVYAMDGICSHDLADLSEGRLDGPVVECPRHFARYDVRTGKVLRSPADVEGQARDLRSYTIMVEKGCITVDIRA